MVDRTYNILTTSSLNFIFLKEDLTDTDKIFLWAMKNRLYFIAENMMIQGVDYQKTRAKDFFQQALNDGEIGIANVLRFFDKLIWN